MDVLIGGSTCAEIRQDTIILMNEENFPPNGMKITHDHKMTQTTLSEPSQKEGRIPVSASDVQGAQTSPRLGGLWRASVAIN